MIHGEQSDVSGSAALEGSFPDEEIAMNDVEKRIRRLERDRVRFRLVWLPMGFVLPVVVLLAGAGLNRVGLKGDHSEVIADKVVTRSLVIVDEANRPRIDLGIDPTVGAHLFMRSEEGVPLLAMTAPEASGSVVVLDQDGHAVAVITASQGGDGLLRLADAEGRIIARLGRWAGQDEASIKFYTPAMSPEEEGAQAEGLP